MIAAQPTILTSTRRGSVVSPVRGAFWILTSGLGALVLRRLVFGTPSAMTLGEFSLGWGAFATSGVFFPWLEMYAPVVSRLPSGNDQVALTFDDGPHPITTRRVLATLAPTSHRATFFVLGDKVRRHPDVVREIHAAGHCIGIHGDQHDRLHSFRIPSTVHEDILRAQETVESATGVRPRLFRPPLGHTSLTTVQGARRAAVVIVGWSTRGLDGIRGRNPTRILERIGRKLDDGAIVLLHDAAEYDDFEPASCSVLPKLLAMLDARGLTSVGLDSVL